MAETAADVVDSVAEGVVIVEDEEVSLEAADEVSSTSSQSAPPLASAI